MMRAIKGYGYLDTPSSITASRLPASIDDRDADEGCEITFRVRIKRVPKIRGDI